MEIIAAIGALVGLAWLTVVLTRGGLAGGTLLLLLVGSCFSAPFFSLPMSPIPLTADRVLFLLLVLQFLIYARWGRTNDAPATTSDYLLGTLLAVLAVSTFTHDFMAKNALPLSQLLFFYLMPAVVYWIARRTEMNQQTLWGVLASLALFGVYLSITAIAETRQMWSLVFPSYISSPTYVEFFGRGRGPFLNPIATGSYISVALVAALLAWPWLRRGGQLALLSLVAPLFLAGIYCTLTRSIWMGAAFSLALIIGLSLPRGWRASVLSALVLGAVIGTAASWDHLNSFKRDKDLSAADMAQSAKLRPILATIAWKMFEDRPVLGCGFGQYRTESKAYLADRTTDLPLEKGRLFVQHNVFLGLLTETGVVGTSLFVLLLGFWTRDAWHVWNCREAPLWVRQCGLLWLGALAVYLPNGMFHNVAIMPMFNMLFFYLAGVLAAVLPLASGASAAAPRLRVWLPASSAAAH